MKKLKIIQSLNHQTYFKYYKNNLYIKKIFIKNVKC